jgi:hypothetical protein
MTIEEHDELLAAAIEDCFAQAGAQKPFLRSALFDAIQLKLMVLFQRVYTAGYNNGVAHG